jgi:hypothetical protein
MKPSSRPALFKVIGTTLCLIFLLAVFIVNSLQNSSHEDPLKSNFLKFWIAGHMILSGQNPYDATPWYDEHTKLGAAQIDDKIFLYPLPQAFFLVPLGLFPISESFIILGVLSQLIIAASCFILLKISPRSGRTWLFLPLVLFLLFFGPVYLSLQIGSIGAFALAVLVAAILLLERRMSFLTGIVLATLILKSSQGLPILFLFGVWRLFKRDWNVIFGMATGGLVLLLSGLIYDPQWIEKFIDVSQTVSKRTLGMQSNIYSFAYLGCNKDIHCMGITGTIGIFIVLGLGSYHLWRNRDLLTTWEVINVIVPLGFISTIYLWSYDQLLYIIPIVWIVIQLITMKKSYLAAFLFLLGLDILSFAVLYVLAKTHEDLMSISTTIVILGMCLWLSPVRKASPIDKPIPAV